MAAVPLLLHPPPSQKSWIWDTITGMGAAAAPAWPPVIAHLQAGISHVICPDSVCLRTSLQSTGHLEDMPGGHSYENIHHQLPNTIIVTVTQRKAKALPRQVD